MNKHEFDYYNLVVCSRGPATETMTVVRLHSKEVDFPFPALAETQFKQFGAFEVDSRSADEGPSIAVPKGTRPLDAIYKWLAFDMIADQENVDSWADNMPEEGKEIFAEVRALEQSNTHAYLSASLRAFLPEHIPYHGAMQTTWTSCNAWRKLELEIPSKKQFEQLMAATGQTAAQLGEWNCKVMKTAAVMYAANRLPQRGFHGC